MSHDRDCGFESLWLLGFVLFLSLSVLSWSLVEM